MNRFGPLYMAAVGRRWCWRLGVLPRDEDSNAALVAACEKTLREDGWQPDGFFHHHRGGRNMAGELSDIIARFETAPSDHRYWSESTVQSMLIDEVESIWDAIAEHDDWKPLEDKVAAIRRMGEAHGAPPTPAAHEQTCETA